jgi:hypothetical protein
MEDLCFACVEYMVTPGQAYIDLAFVLGLGVGAGAAGIDAKKTKQQAHTPTVFISPPLVFIRAVSRCFCSRSQIPLTKLTFSLFYFSQISLAL